MADVNTLDSKVQTLTYQPAQLANGAVELLNEVAGSKITGEEDRYSHTDLSDFQGNLTGALVAFKLLKPALESTGNKALATTIQQRFADVAGDARHLQALDPARLRLLRRADHGRPAEAGAGGRRPGRAALDGGS